MIYLHIWLSQPYKKKKTEIILEKNRTFSFFPHHI